MPPAPRPMIFSQFFSKAIICRAKLTLSHVQRLGVFLNSASIDRSLFALNLTKLLALFPSVSAMRTTRGPLRVESGNTMRRFRAKSCDDDWNQAEPVLHNAPSWLTNIQYSHKRKERCNICFRSPSARRNVGLEQVALCAVSRSVQLRSAPQHPRVYLPSRHVAQRTFIANGTARLWRARCHPAQRQTVARHASEWECLAGNIFSVLSAILFVPVTFLISNLSLLCLN